MFIASDEVMEMKQTASTNGLPESKTKHTQVLLTIARNPTSLEIKTFPRIIITASIQKKTGTTLAADLFIAPTARYNLPPRSRIQLEIFKTLKHSPKIYLRKFKSFTSHKIVDEIQNKIETRDELVVKQ